MLKGSFGCASSAPEACVNTDPSESEPTFTPPGSVAQVEDLPVEEAIEPDIVVQGPPTSTSFA